MQTTPKPDAASRRADDPLGSDSDFIRGTYRRLGELNAKFDRFFALVAKALHIEESPDGEAPSSPKQPPLPGMPEADWSEPVLTPPPRVWSNTVKVYDILWDTYGTKQFTFSDMIRDCPDRIAHETDGRRISVSTYPRVLSALVKAGAATQSRSVYTLTEPSDDLRDLVERTRAKKQQPAA